MSIFGKIKDFFLGKKKNEEQCCVAPAKNSSKPTPTKYGRPAKPVRRKKRATRKPRAVKSYYYKR